MFSKFFWAMMDRGVYLPCSQFEAAFNSVTHDDDIIDLTLKAARESFAEINS
jgi:glutamate-1-semialdehyde 2,1-aminomutase